MLRLAMSKTLTYLHTVWEVSGFCQFRNFLRASFGHVLLKADRNVRGILVQEFLHSETHCMER